MLKVSKKTIVSGAIGNALEMYDYVIWGLFSVYLTKEFLPKGSSFSDMFFLFLITYFIRPLGSLTCGIISDQIGRKKILTFSVLLMGICTSVVGFLPSYERIGIAAVFLLLLIRLLQVLAVGGEYISSISLLIESCDKTKKGYFGSWAAFGVNMGMLLSSLVGFLLLKLIAMKLLPDWAWRLAFIFSLVTMFFGFWIRRSIPESIEFIIENSRKEKRSFGEILSDTFSTLKSHLFESFLVFLLVWFGATTTVLIFIYSPIYITTINKLHSTDAFLINSISLTLLTTLVPFFGYISDYFGRGKLLIISIFLLLICIYPYFICLTYGSFSKILFFNLILAIPCSCIFSITPVLITEIFPLNVRCSVISIIYSSAACLGGGFSPWVSFQLANYIKPQYALTIIFMVPAMLSLLILILFNKKTLTLKDNNLKLAVSN